MCGPGGSVPLPGRAVPEHQPDHELPLQRGGSGVRLHRQEELHHAHRSLPVQSRSLYTGKQSCWLN